ncbi:MAG TPA: ankyrin repeat domain-containing protein [Solimonas sp.]|nr:ankyrin repeat domain-containing protein [Solimonas sp.]
MIRTCRALLMACCMGLPAAALHAQALVIEARPAPQAPVAVKYPMYEAAKNGDVAAIERLARQGSSVEFVCERCWTPLNCAAFHERPEAVRTLLRLGADPKGKMYNGDTALHGAAGVGNLEITRLLIEAGADVNAIDGEKRTPLDRAAVNGRREVIRELLAHKAGPKLDDAIWLSSLCWVIGMEDIETLRLLLPLGQRPLREAVVAQPPRKGMAGPSDCHPLHYAMSIHNPQITQLLLEAGEDPEETVAGAGQTLVVRAVCESRTSEQRAKLSLLLKHGSRQLNQRNDRGQTALLCAAEDDEVETMRLLLEAGADPDLVGKAGMTALDYAVKKRSVRALGLLLAHGASVTPNAGILGAASHPYGVGALLVTALQPYLEQEATEKCPGIIPPNPASGTVNKPRRRLNPLEAEDFPLAQLEALATGVTLKEEQGSPCPARNEAGEALPFNYRAERRPRDDRLHAWSPDGTSKYEIVADDDRSTLIVSRRTDGKRVELARHTTQWIRDSLRAEFKDLISDMPREGTPEERKRAEQFMESRLAELLNAKYRYRAENLRLSADGRYLFYSLRPDLGGWFIAGKTVRHFVVDVQARPAQVWRIDGDLTEVQWHPNARDLYVLMREPLEARKPRAIDDTLPSYRWVARFP